MKCVASADGPTSLASLSSWDGMSVTCPSALSRSASAMSSFVPCSWGLPRSSCQSARRENRDLPLSSDDGDRLKRNMNQNGTSCKIPHRPMPQITGAKVLLACGALRLRRASPAARWTHLQWTLLSIPVCMRRSTRRPSRAAGNGEER